MNVTLLSTAGTEKFAKSSVTQPFTPKLAVSAIRSFKFLCKSFYPT